MSKDLIKFVSLLQTKIDEYNKSYYPHLSKEPVIIKTGRKYTKIDVGSSGKFMLDNSNEHLYFIKGYGVIDRRKDFGFLPDIIQVNFAWDGYSIIPLKFAGTYASQFGYAGPIT